MLPVRTTLSRLHSSLLSVFAGELLVHPRIINLQIRPRGVHVPLIQRGPGVLFAPPLASFGATALRWTEQEVSTETCVPMSPV